MRCEAGIPWQLALAWWIKAVGLMALSLQAAISELSVTHSRRWLACLPAALDLAVEIQRMGMFGPALLVDQRVEL
jgi:hypothetical protein